MEEQKIYDLIGIGIGPFNLSLAALIDPLEEYETLFFEQKQEFDWHPGMLIEGMDLQTPFLADLVTFANPTSPYTFLNYLHTQNRLYPFYFFNSFDIPREEYNDYCKWVASQLKHCYFDYRVVDVEEISTSSNSYYKVVVKNGKSNVEETYFSKHMVIGTGSIPFIPKDFKPFTEKHVIHTSQYLYHEEDLKKGKAITLVGSGQSAAEVFYDLLKKQSNHEYKLTWYTRSAGIFQKEEAKIGKEVFSPDYVDYFHQLSFQQRKDALEDLNSLRNGVDPKILRNIYDLLYNRSINEHLPVKIQPATEVNGVTEGEELPLQLKCNQWQEGQSFTEGTDRVILATGYKPNLPDWLSKFKEDIIWEDEKRFKVSNDYRIEFKDKRRNHIFTLTNIEHSHGASATNLGLSVLRNQMIINTIAGKSIYPIPKRTIFQQFSPD
ncbi:putative monooxygenase [Bacillus sp. TS-2]|nr:putative monooxygenase [Bacillus sp. TS-2]